jgi:transglutaminase-like putative cysteine protease
LALAADRPVAADGVPLAPVVHEPIPPDPREDLALSVLLDGNLPAAIETPRGLLPAPNPDRAIAESESSYGPSPRENVPGATFRVDRDTRRPSDLPYDDPFSPSTAPFKRLSAFDSVDASYTLTVKNPRPVPLATSGAALEAFGEDHFFGDMVVDLEPKVMVRIPSVGPGARVLRARAGIGAVDVGFRLYHDSADNWFIVGDKAAARVRLVVEIAIPRGAFGGDFGNPPRTDLARATPLPARVATAAAEVARTIGVTRSMSPRDNLTKLVEYFRGFTDSNEPPEKKRDIYLDLALSKKGVCRHRAFAFMITALSIGIPARMIMNEAHAWVEVHNGRLWQRIDLGGAGGMLASPLAANTVYEPPPDPFAWPHGSARGEDLARRARRQTNASSPSASGANGEIIPNGTSIAIASALPTSPQPSLEAPALPAAPVDRPPTTLTIAVESTEARRGAPIQVSGQARARGEVCGQLAVQIVLGGRGHDIVLGELVTNEHGDYKGPIVIPTSVPLGDYDLGATTTGNARCGSGQVR